MRRLLTTGVLIGLLAGFAATPALADQPEGPSYKSEDNTAVAQFGEAGIRGARVILFERIRDDERFNSLSVNLQVFSYQEPFTWCTGDTDASGINSYYFRQNGAYVDADIEVWCAGSSEPQTVHVEATWVEHGTPYVTVNTTAGWHDEEFLYTNVYRSVHQDVSEATLELSTDFLGEVPDYDQEGYIHLITQHSILPHGEG